MTEVNNKNSFSISFAMKLNSNAKVENSKSLQSARETNKGKPNPIFCMAVTERIEDITAGNGEEMNVKLTCEIASYEFRIVTCDAKRFRNTI